LTSKQEWPTKPRRVASKSAIINAQLGRSSMQSRGREKDCGPGGIETRADSGLRIQRSSAWTGSNRSRARGQQFNHRFKSLTDGRRLLQGYRDRGRDAKHLKRSIEYTEWTARTDHLDVTAGEATIQADARSRQDSLHQKTDGAGNQGRAAGRFACHCQKMATAEKQQS